MFLHTCSESYYLTGFLRAGRGKKGEVQIGGEGGGSKKKNKERLGDAFIKGRPKGGMKKQDEIVGYRGGGGLPSPARCMFEGGLSLQVIIGGETIPIMPLVQTRNSIWVPSKGRDKCRGKWRERLNPGEDSVDTVRKRAPIDAKGGIKRS